MSNNWESLSLDSKSKLMRIYLQNGISSLDAIKEHYNSYASGGSIEDDEPPSLYKLPAIPGTTPETSDNTYLSKPITNIELDRVNQLPLGTTTVRDAVTTKRQPTIKSKRISKEDQNEINNNIKIQKALNHVNKVLDVAENVPVIGDAVTTGRTLSDITHGDYKSAAILPLMFLSNKIPFGKKIIKQTQKTPLVLARTLDSDGLNNLLKFNYTEGAPSLGMMPNTQTSLDRLADTYANNEGITFIFDKDILKQPHLSFLGDADTPIRSKAIQNLKKKTSEINAVTPEEIVEGKRLSHNSIPQKPISDRKIIKSTRKNKFLRDDEFYNEVLMNDILDYRNAKGAIINTDNNDFLNMLEELNIPYGINLQSIPFDYKGF